MPIRRTAAYVDDWTKKHPNEVSQWKKDNPGTPDPKAADLAVLFFEKFSKENPGKFPSAVTHQGADGKTVTAIEPVNQGSDIQSIFFDMWRQEHADAPLQDVPADMVMASGSGLDPHISLQNAEYQLDRISQKWASDTKRIRNRFAARSSRSCRRMRRRRSAGSSARSLSTCFKLNLALRNQYGQPQVDRNCGHRLTPDHAGVRQCSRASSQYGSHSHY